LVACGETSFFPSDDVTFIFEAEEFGAESGAFVGLEFEGAGELGFVERLVVAGVEQGVDTLPKILHGVIVG